MAKNTDFYQVTKHPKYNNFVVGMDIISKCKGDGDILKFVYIEDGETITKYVDMKVVGPHLRYKPMPSGIDEETGEKKKNGKAFIVPEEIIYAYDDSAFREEMQSKVNKSDWDALASMGIIINKK